MTTKRPHTPSRQDRDRQSPYGDPVAGHPKHDRRRGDRRSPVGSQDAAEAEARAVEQYAERIQDPAERLKYLRSQGHRHTPEKSPTPSVLLHETAGPRTPAPVFAAGPLAWLGRHRFATAGIATALLITTIGIWGTGTVVAPVERAGQTQQGEVPVGTVIVPPTARIPSALEAAASLSLPPAVWQVESTKTTEVYSNGLQIDTRFQTNYQPRARYPIFALPENEDPGTRSFARQIGEAQEPRGILYHTTESQLLPFAEEASRNIDRLGKSLARLLQSEHAYHYLIDRFGRVFRIVKESDAAGHSGFSVWADGEGLYVNLNHSFIGISFEARSGEVAEVTAAQITAARMLTEMLRYRYSIPEENCITHAQVSVNPDNMKLGNHTDWAHSFPFKAVGLPDNYSLPPAAIWGFGYLYDEDLIARAGGMTWAGLPIAEQRLTRQAADQGLTLDEYRKTLRTRYQQIRRELKAKGM